MSLAQIIANIEHPITGKSSERLNAELARKIKPHIDFPVGLIRTLLLACPSDRITKETHEAATNFLQENS